MSETQQAVVARVVDAFNECWLRGRYDDLAAYVHERVVLMPPGTTTPITGRDAFVQSYRDFGSSASLDRFEAAPPRIDVWGTTAVAHCPFTVTYELEGTTWRGTGADILVLAESETNGWLITWRTLHSKEEAL